MNYILSIMIASCITFHIIQFSYMKQAEFFFYCVKNSPDQQVEDIWPISFWWVAFGPG